MIITSPTGLYQDAGQLPIKATDSGNVTWTISSESPARSPQLVIQLPVAEELRPRSPLVYDDETRRVAFGELIYTIVAASRTETGSNKKLFEVGETLEFSDVEAELPTLDSIPAIVDIQHNTNLLDLNESGLSQNEADELVSLSEKKKKELEDLIASLKSQVENTKTAIVENQKALNETRKITEAAQEVLGAGSGEESDPIIQKLIDREESLTIEHDQLITELNDLNIQLADTFDSLLKVSTLVR